MEPTPSEPTAGRRRICSKEHPPDLSLIIKTHTEHKTSYIEEFNSRENRMRQIVEELEKIAAEVKKMQRDTDIARRRGLVVAGVGLGLALLAAPFTGGLSSAVGVITKATAAGIVTVIATNVSKTMIQDGSAIQAEKLGEEFMELVDPLKKRLQRIQTLFKELEEKSAAAQTETEEFKRILEEMSELRKVNRTLFEIKQLTQVMDDLHRLIVMTLNTVTLTPEEDKKLTDFIIQSADQSQRVVEAFQQMREELKKQITEEKRNQAEKSSGSV